MRRALALALVAAALLASSSTAAPPSPQLTDATGDAPVASADIVSATLGLVTRHGRAHLQIDVTYADAVISGPPHTRGLTFTVGGCRFAAAHYPLLAAVSRGSDVGCSTGASAGHTGSMQVNGRVLTFRIALDGKDLRRGARVTDLAAFTHPGGAFALHTPLTTAGDVAEGRDWVLR